MVEGFGVDYAGHSYGVPTDGQGNYCIQNKTSAITELTASWTLSGLTTSASIVVTADGTSSTCATGATQVNPDIVLAKGLSCVSGTVLDSANQPVAGVGVFTSAGSHTITAADGTYQVPVPAESAVNVYTYGNYPPVAVTSPAVGAACAEANLVAAISTGGTTCMSGPVYQCSPDNPYGGITVEIHDLGGNLLGSDVSGADGQYCVDGLPANIDVLISETTTPFGGLPIGGLNGTPVNTGAPGGTCVTNTCSVGLGVDVYCY